MQTFVPSSPKFYRGGGYKVRKFASIFDTSRIWRTLISKRSKIAEILNILLELTWWLTFLVLRHFTHPSPPMKVQNLVQYKIGQSSPKTPTSGGLQVAVHSQLPRFLAIIVAHLLYIYSCCTYCFRCRCNWAELLAYFLLNTKPARWTSECWL